jgi:hypothetical protein
VKSEVLDCIDSGAVKPSVAQTGVGPPRTFVCSVPVNNHPHPTMARAAVAAFTNAG